MCVWCGVEGHSRWQFSCQHPAEWFDFLVTIRDSCIQIESVFLSVWRLQLECLDRFTEKRWGWLRWSRRETESEREGDSPPVFIIISLSSRCGSSTQPGCWIGERRRNAAAGGEREREEGVATMRASQDGLSRRRTVLTSQVFWSACQDRCRGDASCSLLQWWDQITCFFFMAQKAPCWRGRQDLFIFSPDYYTSEYYSGNNRTATSKPAVKPGHA